MTQESGNAAHYFVDRHRNGPVAAKIAFVESGADGRAMTYSEFATKTDRMASIYARHGLRREERALMLVLDQIEFPVIFWGSLKAGIVPVPINTMQVTEIYDMILRDSRARALFVSAELLPVIAPVLVGNPYLASVFVIGGGDDFSLPQGMFAFADELAMSAPLPAISVAKDESAFWLYSSGSTGKPKGTRHIHGSLQFTADTYGQRVLGIRADDVVFSIAKLFFAYGLGNGMTFPLSVGATTVLMKGRPTPVSVFEVMQAFSPTIFYGVPTLYASLLAAMAGKLPPGFEKLRLGVSAGEALPEEIGKKWRALTGTDILDGVGSTEMLHIFLSNAPGDVVYGTSGFAVPGYEVRLVDEHNADVAAGGIGELLVKGGSAASDYWNQRDKSRTTFEGEWTRTGDKYELREDGRMVYCGRTDDMFKVSGIWVAPFEIEQALISHPCVLEAAVIAAKDGDGLEKPKAFVVLKDGADGSDLAAQLKDHVKSKIGKWKYPRWVEIVPDLPKTATGKIQRFKLRS